MKGVEIDETVKEFHTKLFALPALLWGWFLMLLEEIGKVTVWSTIAIVVVAFGILVGMIILGDIAFIWHGFELFPMPDKVYVVPTT